MASSTSLYLSHGYCNAATSHLSGFYLNSMNAAQRQRQRRRGSRRRNYNWAKICNECTRHELNFHSILFNERCGAMMENEKIEIQKLFQFVFLRITVICRYRRLPSRAYPGFFGFCGQRSSSGARWTFELPSWANIRISAAPRELFAGDRVVCSYTQYLHSGRLDGGGVPAPTHSPIRNHTNLKIKSI